MKNLPIGIQTFSEIINKNHVYVDKTKDIYKLFSDGGKYYFLSRPRRFGKSLLISTLKEIFSGNKKLFKGLWIYNKIEWEKFPIIYIDFSKMSYNTGEALKNSLSYTLDKIAAQYNVSLPSHLDYKIKFTELIELLSKKAPVVILIDEYDKPIIDYVDKLEIATENRKILNDFYNGIKGSDEYLKFVFITGVSKFSKVSIFSGLNNLRDITISTAFSTILGYTQDELLFYFSNRIDKMNGEKERLIKDIKKWYNGYSWDGKQFVYNPFSILNLFQEERFGNYWFTTGTPTFLIKSIKEKNIDIKRVENYETTRLLFDSYEIEQINVFALLFQTGYITIKEIKDVSTTESIYRFSYPNEEVKQSLMDYIVADYTGKPPDEISYLVHKLKTTINECKIDEFFTLMKSVFASVPYNIFIEDKEAYYHTVIYLIFTLLGIDIRAEVETNIGRIDGVLETDTHIFIMEFKVGNSSDAIRQIKDRKYYEKYLPTTKQIKLIGVGFNIEKKNIDGFNVEDFLSSP